MDKHIARVCIRAEIIDILKHRVCLDEKRLVEWYLERMREYDLPISAMGVILAARVNYLFEAPNIGSDRIRTIYDGASFKDVMTYEEFVFKFNGIWIKTLVSILKGWDEKYNENTETAY